MDSCPVSRYRVTFLRRNDGVGAGMTIWGIAAYFCSKRSCRLSPTPPIMKVSVGAIRESSLREVGRGMDSRLRGNDGWWGGIGDGQPHKGWPYRSLAGGYFQRNDKSEMPISGISILLESLCTRDYNWPRVRSGLVASAPSIRRSVDDVRNCRAVYRSQGRGLC